MSDAIFWGLSKADFTNSMINSGYASATFAIGMTVAASVSYLALRTLADAKNKTLTTKALCGVAGAVVGIGASFYVAYHLTPITFVAEKSLKFLALTIPATLGGPLALATSGGALGYFGRGSLYFTGLLGGLQGALIGVGLTHVVSRNGRK